MKIQFIQETASKGFQGGCARDGKIYSVEGFCNNAVIRPAIRVIDVDKKEQSDFFDFYAAGVITEAELSIFTKTNFITATEPAVCSFYN